MNNRKPTVADFNKEIHLKFLNKLENIHIESFKDYCKTFEIDLFCTKFFVDPTDKSLNSETEIKQELITFFRPKKLEILEYRYDYYTSKTVKQIANIIEKDTDRVVAYLERIKHTFQNGEVSSLSKYGDIIEMSLVKEISSFKILKELQLVESHLLLSKKVSERITDHNKLS